MIERHKSLVHFTSEVSDRLSPEDLDFVQKMMCRLKSVEDVIRVSELDQFNMTQDILRIVKPKMNVCLNCVRGLPNGNTIHCSANSGGAYRSKYDTCHLFKSKNNE